MRAVKLLVWIALNLLSFVVPAWVGWELVEEEQAWRAANPYSPGDPDTPLGALFFAPFIAWAAVLLVLNAVSAAVFWWRRMLARVLCLADNST